MPPPGAAREQHTWFGPSHPPAAATPAAAELEPSTGFTRLWTAFMSARVLVALALLGLHIGLHLVGVNLGDVQQIIAQQLLQGLQGAGVEQDRHGEWASGGFGETKILRQFGPAAWETWRFFSHGRRRGVRHNIGAPLFLLLCLPLLPKTPTC